MYAFIDETGDPGYSIGASKHMIVAGIVCTDIDYLRRIVKRARLTLRHKQKMTTELKGAHLPPAVTRRVLKDLITQDIGIYIARWDKSISPALGEQVYELTFAACARRMLVDYPTLKIIADQRYNVAEHQTQFVQNVRNLTGIPNLTVLTDRSDHEKALQVVDRVAWSLHQWYEHENDTLYKLIVPRIRAEFSVEIKKTGSTWGV
jgi:hypothetical protein